MTTVSPAAPTTRRIDPAAVVGRTTPHSSLSETGVQTLAMAWRALKKMRRKPEQFFDVIIQPLLFTAMFAFIFGGAISGTVSHYLPTLIPGILAQTALTVCMVTGVQLREDMDKGVFDRFKSLPMARIAPLAGPMAADLIRYLIASVLTLITGLVIGYRPGGGPLGCVAGIALTVAAGWSLAWIFAWLGTMARSAQSVQGISLMIMFPLTFLSNAFVPARSLPDWLQKFVQISPVSHVVSAVRDLFNHGTVTAEVGWAVIGCAAVVVIFAPLAVRSYSRKM